MVFRWAFPLPVSDPDLAAEVETGWPTQAEAETWLKDFYLDLVDLDIHQATLTDDITPLYTMSLDD